MFDEELSEAELSARQPVKSVIKNCLGYNRRVEYEKEIEELLQLTRNTNVSKTALSVVTLGVFSQELVDI